MSPFLLCNGVTDCLDGSDESEIACGFVLGNIGHIVHACVEVIECIYIIGIIMCSRSKCPKRRECIICCN